MRTNTFLTGVLAGAALGFLIVMAVSPEAREPMMQGTGRMGKRMRRMWRQGSDAAMGMMPTKMMTMDFRSPW